MRAPRLLLRLAGKALAFAALLAVFAAGSANAQNLCYADTGGDDAQSGLTPATAKETIQACVNEARVTDGGLISIEAGTYNEQVTFPDGKGVNLEVRATGTFTRVIVSDGFIIEDNVTVRPNSEGLPDGVFRLEPDGANRALDLVDGSLTITDPDGPAAGGRVRIASGEVRLDDDTSVTGELTYLSAPVLVYRDIDGSDTDITVGGEFPAAFDGVAAMLDVDLGGGNVLNFGSVVFSGGADLNVAADSELEGTIVVEGDIDITGGGDAGSLDVNDGTVNIAGTLTVEDVDIADNDDIVFDFNSNTLTVTGSFTRQGGSLAGTGGATLAFVGDDSDEVFGPGPNFSVQTLTVDKDGQQLEITEDVNVTASGAIALSIAAGTEVDFTGNQINVTMDGWVDVDGDVTGLSTIVFRAAGADIRGDGNYGDILVTTGGGDITVGATTQEDVVFTGTLTLNSGGITVGGDDDLSPADGATVSVNLASAGQDIDGDFNTEGNDYHLIYTGDMGGATLAVGSEFATNDLLDLTFNVEDGTVDASGAPNGTISGNVALNDVGDAYEVDFPADVTIEGSLTVQGDATLDGTDVTLEGSTNSVQGTVSAATTLHLTDGVTLTGIDDDDFPATVGSVEVNGTATIDDIQVIDGDVTTNANANLTIGLADEMSITGMVTLDGTSFTLASELNVDGDIVANDGTLAFGGFDVNLDGDLDGAADVAYTSSGGALVFTSNGLLGLNGETLPRLVLEEDVDVDLTSDAVISEEFIESGVAYLGLDGNDLTIGGSIVSDGGLFIGVVVAGNLTIETATIELDGDASVDPPTTIADGATVEIVSADPADEWTLSIIAGADFMLEGTLVLNQNSLEIDGGDLLNNGGAITADGGAVIMGGGDIEVDGALGIPNLTIDAATDLGVATDGDLTIEQMLTLNAALNENDADDELILADGVTIVINTATPLSDEPEFAGAVNLEYNVATDSGEEIPDAGDGTVQDVDVNAAVEIQKDLTVDGVLALGAPIDNTTQGVDLVLGSGATLSLEIDNAVALAAADIEASEYTLEYAGPADTISNVEFVTGATVTVLRVDLAVGTDVITLDEDRSVQSVELFSGDLDLDGNDFDIAGDLTIDGGDLVNTAADAMLSFVGGNAQAVSLDGTLVPNGMDIVLAKDDTSMVTVSGGNIDLRAATQTLFLNGGILETMGNAEIFLQTDATTQGFVRTVDENAGEVSHVAGNVTKFLPQGDPFAAGRSARYEYPVGDTLGNYRPLALTFRENVATNTSITVNHEERSPGGTLGLPVADDTGLLIGNYPDFFWLIDATTSLGQAQRFDVELTATEIGIPFTNEDDLRIIRRFDGSATTNEWRVQGEAANYDNFVAVDANDDTTAVVRVLNSSGGIVTQGARFTLGLPTRAPLFVTAEDTLTVNEGEILTFDFDADPQDLGESVTYGLGDGAPDFVSIDAQTGVLTANPGFEDAGTYVFDITANDGSDTTAHQLTLIVRDIFEIMPAQGDTTIADGETLFIDFDVSDPNPADPVMWSIAQDVDNAAIDATTGEFTFTPDFDQSGQVYTFTIVAENSTDSVSVTFDVSVTGEILLGDVNDSGAMTLADVSLTLAAVIGDTMLSSKGQIAADVSGAAGVSAFDAALMLQCLAAHGPTVEDTSVCEFPAEGANKTNAIVASADITWGKGENTENGVAIPVTLSGTVKNVYSVEVTADVDMTATTLQNVTGKMPEGWQLAWTADKETGTIRVAMFGATPINYEGEVARLIFSLNENETSVNLQGDAFVNENPAVQLGSTSVKEIPAEFALSDNYPNPFNPTTTFTYSLPEASHVTIEVYDVAGRLVQTLVNGEKEAGRYEVKWDGRNAAGSSVASGVYLYRINAQSFTQVKTMMLVK